MNIKSALNQYTKTIRYGNGNNLVFSLDDYLDILEYEISSMTPDITEEEFMFKICKLSYIAGLSRGMKNRNK